MDGFLYKMAANTLRVKEILTTVRDEEGLKPRDIKEPMAVLMGSFSPCDDREDDGPRHRETREISEQYAKGHGYFAVDLNKHGHTDTTECECE